MPEIYEISDTISLFSLLFLKIVYSSKDCLIRMNIKTRKSLEIAISGITGGFFFIEISETRFGEENILETSYRVRTK